MYWLLKPFGASLEQAYFACHLLLNLAGVWCLYYLFSRAMMPARPRLVAFTILAIAGFGLWMGVNGALVRYLFPFASLLLGHRAALWALSGRGRTVCWAGAAVAILMLLFGNILLSSDAGVAFALGYLVILERADEAEAGWQQLIAERPDEEATIAQIAGDTLSAENLHDRALPWVRRHLELALTATPRRSREISYALRVLERESANAGVAPDAELVERAARAIADRGAPHPSR